MKSVGELRIFDYSDYRTFLSDFYTGRKEKNPNYSHRVFAQQAGLSSPSHLLMIINGSRNLSTKTIPKFVEGLKLKGQEASYFELLIQYNQSENLEQKSRYFGEMMAMRSIHKSLHPLEKERFEFLSKWYIVAIYVLVDLKNFDPHPNWIVKKLGGKITPLEAKEALGTLLRLGFLVETEKGLKQAQGAITVPDDTKAVGVYNYHQSMLKLASEALRVLPVPEREAAGVTLAIPKAKLQQIKDRIREFRKEINQLASSLEDPTDIYQLNIQFFPLSESDET